MSMPSGTGVFFLPTSPDSNYYGAPSGFAYTNRYKDGVGGGNDLKVRVVRDPNGNWWPQIHKGFYYLGGTQERYLFADRRLETITMTASASPTPYAFGNVSLVPSGGAFMAFVVSGALMTYAPSTLRVYDNTTGWTHYTTTGSITYTSDYLWYKQFTRGIVVGVMGTSGAYKSRESSGDLIHEGEYWFQDSTNRLWVKRLETSDELNFCYDIYTTWVDCDPSMVSVRQEEISQVDRLGRVRTKYDHVFISGDTNPSNPVLVVPHPSNKNTVAVTGVTDGNVLHPHPSGGVLPGDLVGVRYFASGTYCIASGATSGLIKAFLPALGNPTQGIFYFDDPKLDYFDVGSMNPTDLSRVQLNPTKEEVDSGFLYLSMRRPQAADAAYILVGLPESSVVSGMTRPRVTATVLDRSMNPVPGVLLEHRETNFTVQPIFPSGSVTSAMGRVHYLISTSGSSAGLCSGTFKVSGNTAVSASYTFSALARSSYIANKEYLKPKVFLYLDRNPVANGMCLLYAHVCYPDGLWAIPSWKDYTITICCERGSLHSDTNPDSNSDGRVVSTKVGTWGHAPSVYYKLTPGDRLWATTTVYIWGSWVTVRSPYIEIEST